MAAAGVDFTVRPGPYEDLLIGMSNRTYELAKDMVRPHVARRQIMRALRNRLTPSERNALLRKILFYPITAWIGNPGHLRPLNWKAFRTLVPYAKAQARMLFDAGVDQRIFSNPNVVLQPFLQEPGVTTHDAEAFRRAYMRYVAPLYRRWGASFQRERQDVIDYFRFSHINLPRGVGGIIADLSQG